jgi:two-component system, LuxR family, response regulator DctR
LNTVTSAQVIIVDDDDSLATGLEFLFDSKKISTQRFSSGEDFIAAVEQDSLLVDEPGVILLDVRMFGISGFDVFYWVQNNCPKACKSIIFLTGHGELPQAVQMMKRGAFDFIQKPFDSKGLLSTIDLAIKSSKGRAISQQAASLAENRIKTLTDKELLVMKQIYAGVSNREIAEALGNSVRTVELHRASIFSKLEVKNATELARLLEKIKI